LNKYSHLSRKKWNKFSKRSLAKPRVYDSKDKDLTSKLFIVGGQDPTSCIFNSFGHPKAAFLRGVFSEEDVAEATNVLGKYKIWLKDGNVKHLGYWRKYNKHIFPTLDSRCEEAIAFMNLLRPLWNRCCEILKKFFPHLASRYKEAIEKKC